MCGRGLSGMERGGLPFPAKCEKKKNPDRSSQNPCLNPFIGIAVCKVRIIFRNCKLFVGKFYFFAKFSLLPLWMCQMFALRGERRACRSACEFVLSAYEHLHGSFHFEREEMAGEFADGDVCLHGEDVDLLAVAAGEGLENAPLGVGEVGE